LANTQGLLRQESPFTVEIWVRARLGAGGPFACLGDYVMGKHPEVPYPHYAGWFVGVGQTSGRTLSMSSGFGTRQIGGPLGVEEGQWYHLAAVNESDGLTVYVNGKVWFRKLAADQINWQASPINLHIGKTKYDAWKIRDHQIDIRGLRISSTSLYLEEFEPATEFERRSDTMLLLDFAHPQDNKITDLSGNHHHGTIRGARWLPCDRASTSLVEHKPCHVRPKRNCRSVCRASLFTCHRRSQ
jgi:hypothetical protein